MYQRYKYVPAQLIQENSLYKTMTHPQFPYCTATLSAVWLSGCLFVYVTSMFPYQRTIVKTVAGQNQQLPVGAYFYKADSNDGT